MKEACRNTQEAIQLYLDDRLSGGEKTAMEGHIAACEACRAELEAYAVLVAGMDQISLEEPPPGFNEAVLGRIPFPDRVPVRAKRSPFGIRSGILLGVVLAALSSFGLFVTITDSGRILSILTDGFLRAMNAMEWLSVNSLPGVIDTITLADDLHILSSLLLLTRILVNVATTTMSDPVFAILFSVMIMIGIGSTLIMAKLIRPGLSRVPANGANMQGIIHFFC